MILAIDQGTTNTKALLVDLDGRIAASASVAVPIHYPQPGWVEQDPSALWASVVEAASACIRRAGVSPVAIGISNQRESTLAWNRATGQPVGPAITWQCRRTAGICAALRPHEDLIRSRTGLGVDPLFSATKARWLIEHAPSGCDLAIGNVDSWLAWNLTGGQVHATDHTNASRTQLMNLARLEWDEGLAALFQVPVAALPTIHPSSHIYGETVASDAIPAGIPIAALCGDSHAALFGHGIFTPGAVKATYGTGSSLMTLTSAPRASSHGLSGTVGWSASDGARYALEGNISVTGGAVQWLADFLGLAGGAEQVAALAEAVPDAGGVHLVPAFAGLGAPYWDDAARGLLCGLTRGTSAAHAARASLEAIAFQVRDVFDAMELDLGRELPLLLAGGGASRNRTLMQFQADILNRAVEPADAADVSAIGAAWLAGLAVGFWKSVDELHAGSEARIEPRMPDDERESRYSAWRTAVGRAREMRT